MIEKSWIFGGELFYADFVKLCITN